MTSITSGFDNGDDEKVINILDKWDDGPLSDKLFTKLSQLSPQTALITVVFRENNGETETLLLERPEGDPVWPGMLNLPGKMFRKTDFSRGDGRPENGPIERIEESEIGTKFTNRPKFAGVTFQDTKRGPVIVLVCVVNEDVKLTKGGEWHPVKELNSLTKLINTELVVINVALEAYLAGSNHLPSLYPLEFQKKSA